MGLFKRYVVDCYFAVDSEVPEFMILWDRWRRRFVVDIYDPS